MSQSFAHEIAHGTHDDADNDSEFARTLAQAGGVDNDDVDDVDNDQLETQVMSTSAIDQPSCTQVHISSTTKINNITGAIVASALTPDTSSVFIGLNDPREPARAHPTTPKHLAIRRSKRSKSLPAPMMFARRHPTTMVVPVRAQRGQSTSNAFRNRQQQLQQSLHESANLSPTQIVRNCYIKYNVCNNCVLLLSTIRYQQQQPETHMHTKQLQAARTTTAAMCLIQRLIQHSGTRRPCVNKSATNQSCHHRM